MEQITGMLAEYGLALVFVNVFLTQVGVPVPAIPTLIVAGTLVQQGVLSLPAVLVTALAASLLGDVPWFVAGRAFGSRAITALCRVAIEPDSCVKQTQDTFERWGAPSLMFAKFVPGFAIVAPPIAGALGLGTWPFFAYSAIGALAWAGVAVIAGAVFHDEVHLVIQWLANLGMKAVLIIGLAIVVYVAVKWIERWLLIRWLRMTRISVDELEVMLQRENAKVILDVRSATARRLDPRRIPGAIAVDINALDRALLQTAMEAEIVVYCT